MSHHPSSYPSSHYYIPFGENGQSQHSHSIPGASSLDGQARSTALDTLNLGGFGNAPSIASGYLGELGINNLSSVRSATDQQDDRSRFPGQNDRLLQFYRETDGPWNPQKSGGRGHSATLPSSFTVFRETNAPSTVGHTDSGYGSQERQSVGIPSDFGDVDRSSESLLNLVGFQISTGPGHAGLQIHDVNNLVPAWNQVLGRPESLPASDVPKFACIYCTMAFRTQSDRKKHVARHERPHKCPEPGCSWDRGFPNTNELERHLRTKHRKGGIRYRCHHDACSKKPPKDWPRADNFRTHLIKMHGIIIAAEDSLAAYRLAPAPAEETSTVPLAKTSPHQNPEILSNVGAAPELIPPKDLAEVASGQSSWWQLEQEAQPRTSTTRGSGEELRLKEPETPFQSPADARSSGTPARLSSGNFRNSRLPNPSVVPEARQPHSQDLPNRQPLGHDIHLGVEGNSGLVEATYHDVPPPENTGYVRPNDLETSRSPRFPSPASPASPASLAEDREPEVVVLDDDDDDSLARNVRSEGQACQDVDTRNSSPTPHKLPLDDGDLALAEDSAPQPESSGRPFAHSDTGPVSDDFIKPGSPLAVEKTAASPSEELDDITFKVARAELRPLLRQQASEGLLCEPLLSLVKKEQLDENLLKFAIDGWLQEALQKQLDPFLVQLGLVPTKGAQVQAGNGMPEQNPFKNPCPKCAKSFRRPCELTKHMKRHEKPYGCTQCTLAFGSKDDWKRHENGQHLQYEIWRCAEPLPRGGGTCNKQCSRKETFRQHLASHHQITDKADLDTKLDKYRVDERGEPRFWCGFCRTFIKVDNLAGGAAREAQNARYGHIADHYLGLNGQVRKRQDEWRECGAEMAEDGGGVKDPSSSSSARNGKTGGQPLASSSQPRKRNRQGVTTADRAPPKRAKVSQPRDHMMWTCCQCQNTWSFANNASCMSCVSAHERCNDCTVEEVEPTEEHHLQQVHHHVTELSPLAFDKSVRNHPHR